MPKKTKTALSEDGREPLLLGQLACGGVALLLPDRNPQDHPHATEHEGLKAAYMRLEEDSALHAVQQGWEDNAVEDPNLGTGLDLALMPQDAVQ